MKRLVAGLGLVMTLAAGSAFAQDATGTALDKEARKEWKKKLKAMEPEDLYNLSSERDRLKTDNERLSTEKDKAQSDLKSQMEETTQLKNALEKSKTDYQQLAEKLKEGSMGNATEEEATKASPNGVVYKVQIGSFRNKDLSKYFGNHKNFSGETDSDGTKKYTLGVFPDYWEADNFKKYLREMGVQDAWIVSYKNGKRIPIKDALEGAI